MHSVAARLEGEAGPVSRSPMVHDGANGFVLDRTVSAGDVAMHGGTQRRLDRRQSKSRRELPSRQSSLSGKQAREEQKTVGEYALHVLFTSVSFALGLDRNRSQSPTITLS